MSSVRVRILLVALAALALPCEAAQWVQVRKSNDVMLSVDNESLTRSGDEMSVKYLVDFRTPQGDMKDTLRYRSIVVSARVHCRARTIMLLETEAYGQYGGRGVAIARDRPKGKERGFKPLEAGSSDEDLWRFACEGKKAAPQK